MRQKYPHLENLFKAPNVQHWGLLEATTINEFLDHVKSAVECALQHPEEALVRKTMSDPLPRDFGALPPVIEFFAGLFNARVEFDPKYDFDVSAQSPKFDVAPASGEVLVLLRLAERRASILRLCASWVAVDRCSYSGSNWRFESPWNIIRMNIDLAVEPISFLCNNDWRQVQLAVSSMSQEAFSALQAQLEKYQQDMAGTFSALFRAISALHEGDLDEGFDNGIRHVLYSMLKGLPGRADLLDQTLDLMFMWERGSHQKQQICEFKHLINKYFVHMIVGTIKLGALMPRIFSSPLSLNSDSLSETNPEQLLNAIQGQKLSILYETQSRLSRLQCMLRETSLSVLEDQVQYGAPFVTLICSIERLLEVMNDGSTEFGSKSNMLLEELYVGTVKILRLLDRIIEEAAGVPDESERYRLVAAALLPPSHDNSYNTGVIALVLTAQDALCLLKSKIAVPAGYKYDPDGSALMRYFPPILPTMKSAKSRDSIEEGQVFGEEIPTSAKGAEISGSLKGDADVVNSAREGLGCVLVKREAPEGGHTKGQAEPKHRKSRDQVDDKVAPDQAEN